MVECLGSCLRHLQVMEHSVSYGLEPNANLDMTSPTVTKPFEKASSKAKAALQAAESYVPFCSKEPRLKGSFAGQLLIYNEVIFVLHQIIDRMDNMVTLRAEYGSGPLQEYSVQVSHHRRNLAASVVTCLFAVQEAFSTRLALPQFIPSARLAHIRLINHVRDIFRGNTRRDSNTGDGSSPTMRESFLSWNATAMSMAEIIEYLEELVELAKLLVGVNEFRTGLFFRPSYREYLDVLQRNDTASIDGPATAGLQRRTTFRRASKGSQEAEVPAPLKRIQSRKFDAVLKRRQTLEDKGK